MHLSFLPKGFLTGSVALAAVSIASAAPSAPTFYKDVLPVLQKNCQTCHRPGEAVPMSLLTYDSARPWAKAIKTAVATRKMPPWFADPHVGKFGNDPTLSQDDIVMLAAWADSGAVAGDPKDSPKPLEFVEGWKIGQPDAIIRVPKAFNIPASGTVDYQYIIVPTGFTEDKYVSMAEARPSNPSVTHHILAFVREPGSSFMKGAPANATFSEKQLRSEMEAKMKKMAQDNPEAFKKMREAQQKGGGPDAGGGDFGDMIAGYAPGTAPNILKPGQVKLVPAGSDIVFQIHYTANGKEASDISALGLKFADYKPVERVLTLAATTQDFVIPAGNPNYQVDSKIKLQDDATLVNLLPHMHFRGKSFEYRVTYPSGEKETLLDVPNYDFNWQLTYDLAKPKVLPKGTVIECTAHYDNSADNKWNPDPTKDVRYGEQTWEEMMFGFFDVSVPLNKTAMDLMVPEDKRPHKNAGF